jgi:hypothetical protein
MRMFMLLSSAIVFCALLAAGAPSVFAQGADLTKIERTIAKEPAYKSKPKYCLLVFGPEAKFRVWLVIDGNAFYIDRNGNGDLTEPGEQVAWKGDLKTMALGIVGGTDGKPRCTVSLRKFPASVRLTVSDEAKQVYMAGDSDSDPLVFADRPVDAPVVHVGGPLSIDLSHYDRLCLRVRVGTAGLGKGTFAASVLPNITPIAEIEFPSKQPGGPPIFVKTALKDR